MAGTRYAQYLHVAHQRRLFALRAALLRQINGVYRQAVGDGESRPIRPALDAISLEDDRFPPISEAIVRQTMRAFETAEPIRLVSIGDGRYRLVDGRHRLEAARRLGRDRIDAVVGADVEIDPAFERFGLRAVPLIAAAQAAAQDMEAAYLRALLTAEMGETVEPPTAPGDIVGRTEKGLPLAIGMAPFAAMVKAQIGTGKTPAEALEYGRYLAARFADAEVIRVSDETSRAVAMQTPLFSGWFGSVNKDACDPCWATNDGEHSMDAEFYRHAACKCTREWLVA